MTLTQIHYFVKTAEKCNFTQAAAELYITQQVLSRQIQALEKEIGFPLFSRENRRRVELTEAGRLMFETWQPLLEQTEAALAQAKNLSQKQTIRIGMPNIAQIVDVVMSVILQYMDKHPDYEIELVVDSTNKIFWSYEQKELDAMIALSIDTKVYRETSQVTELMEMEFGVICNKRHSLAKKDFVGVKDLHRQELCMFKDSYAKNIEKPLLDIFENAGIKPGKIRRFDNWQNMALALELGSGINLGFQAFLVEQRGLVFVPLDERPYQEDILLVAFDRDDRAAGMIAEIKKVL